MIQEDMTELRRKELEASEIAWERYWERKNSPALPPPPLFTITIGGDFIEEPASNRSFKTTSETNVTTNISRNIGKPEKKRGWEYADIQYHGDTFHHGEW